MSVSINKYTNQKGAITLERAEAVIVGGLTIIGTMLTISNSHKVAAVWVFFAAYLVAGLAVATRLTSEFRKPAPNELDKARPIPLESATPNPLNPMRKKEPHITIGDITSHNQSGGFTGVNQGILNLGPQPRIINPENRQQFLESAKSAPKGKIIIRFIDGNDESRNFALQLRELLISAGYDVRPDMQGVSFSDNARVGVFLEAREKSKPPKFAETLQSLFGEIGIIALGASGVPAQTDDEIGVLAGLNPPPTQ